MKQNKNKKKKKWIRVRHRVLRNLAYAVLYPYMRARYHVRIERYKQDTKGQYLILFNHQTGMDQFIVGSAFKQTVYYLASEDLFSNGAISRLLEWAVAPIPIKKQATDARAVLNCMRVAKEGGTIALSPEGNRTFSGKTEYIKPAVVALVKALKMPLALYRIEGGYGVHPRWSDTVRKGEIHAYVSKVVQPEEYLAMTDDELMTLIAEELYVDDCASARPFETNKSSAEYLERAYYVCPTCGLTEYKSFGKFFQCQKCGQKIAYHSPQRLEAEGEYPFQTIKELYDHQSDFINRLPLNEMGDTLLYSDMVCLSEVRLYERKQILCENARVELRADRIVAQTDAERLEFSFQDLSTVTVLGKNKLNLYYGDKLYQFKGDKRFNAVKYVQLCYRAKNLQKGDIYGKFLGL